MFHNHDIVSHTINEHGTLDNSLLLTLRTVECSRAKQIARRMAADEATEGRAVSIVHLVGDDSAGAVYQEVISA